MSSPAGLGIRPARRRLYGSRVIEIARACDSSLVTGGPHRPSDPVPCICPPRRRRPPARLWPVPNCPGVSDINGRRVTPRWSESEEEVVLPEGGLHPSEDWRSVGRTRHRRSPTIDRGVKQGVVDLPLRQTGREGGWIEDCHAEQALGLTTAPHLQIGARRQDLC